MTFTSPVTSIEIFDGQVAEISADQQVYVIKHQNYNAGLQTHQGEEIWECLIRQQKHLETYYYLK